MITRRKCVRLLLVTCSTIVLVAVLRSNIRKHDTKHVFVSGASGHYQNVSSNEICRNVSHNQNVFQMAEDPSKQGEDVLYAVPLATEGALFIYAAYFDERALFSGVYVRLTGMLHRNHLDYLDRLYCHIWFPGSDEPKSAKAEGSVIWKYDAHYQAIILSCPLIRKAGGGQHESPEAVSISQFRCPKTGPAIRIRNGSAPNDGTVAVCTKMTYGAPDPVRLTEWIELNRILGVRTIYLYNTSIRGEANRVLAHYSAMGVVALRQHRFPEMLSAGFLNQTFPTADYGQNWELEILSINDCLYTATEPFLAVIDVDEILYPDRHGSLARFVASDLVTSDEADVVSFVFHTAVYSDELEPEANNSLPWYLHTLRHNRRTRIDWESPKSVTRRRLCLYHAHHMCFRSADGSRLRLDVDHRYGHVRHYRRRCRLTGEPNKCQKLLRNPEVDRSLDRVLPELTERVRNALVVLGLYKNAEDP